MSSILLADDNPHAQRMGSQILSQEGHSVVTVSDGDEAMLYLEDNLPDLVMVDTRMPGPSGFDICKHIKSQPKFGAVKVVLLAGPLEPFDTAEAESAGPDGVLHKPLDAYTLIDTVNSLLGQVPSRWTPPSRRGWRRRRGRSPRRPSHFTTIRWPQNRAAPPRAMPQRPWLRSRQLTSRNLSIDLSDHFASVVEQALGTEDSLKSSVLASKRSCAMFSKRRCRHRRSHHRSSHGFAQEDVATCGRALSSPILISHYASSQF